MKTAIVNLVGLSLFVLVNTNAAWAASGAAVPMQSSTGVGVSKEIDANADQLIHKVSDFYSKLNSISAGLVCDMHVEAPTQSYKNTVESVFEVSAARPNRISFEMKSGQVGGVAKSNGKKVYLYSPKLGETGAYMSMDAPASMTGLFSKQEFAFVSGGMSSLSLMEAVLSSDPYASIMSGVTAAHIVGTEKIDGIETQHLHFAQRDLTWDLWVDKGKEPWIRRVVPDVSKMLAQYGESEKDVHITLTVTYKNVVANPTLTPTLFAFVPPPQAKEVKSFFDSGDEAGEKAKALMRKPAPEFKLDTVSGGKFDLAEHKGKDIVVIDFWATWCPPCQKSLPLINEIVNEYAPKGVKLCAIDIKEDPAKVKEFLKSEKLNINAVLDSTGEVAQSYGVMGIPQTLVVDPDGVVRDVHLGFDDDIKEKLADMFDIILLGKSSK
jgi:thiol-disulfide isomerase/thioredoxin